MATTRFTVIGTFIVAAVFLTTFPKGVTSQSPSLSPAAEAAAPSTDCLTNLLNMSDCLSYVEEGSNLTTPEKPCCPELAGLVESNPICLCQLIGSANSFGVKINLNKALKLPSVCGVTTPPPSLCSLVNGAPLGSPTASEGPGSSGVPSPVGLATAPSSGNNGNGASSIAGSAISFLVGLAIAFLPTLI